MPTNVTFNGTTYPIPSVGEINWTTLPAFLLDLGTNAGLSTIDKQSIRVALTTPVTVSATADYTVVTNLTVPGPITVNLPAGVNGQVFVIVDGKGDAATNNISIIPNGAQTINGAAALVMNRNNQIAILQYSTTGTNWSMIGGYFPDLATTFVNPMDSAGDMVIGGASGTASKLDSGAANKILRAEGAAAPTWCTLAAGTAGTDFAVANAAGAVTLNLPDASATARGVVTTGTQTIAGNKTLTGTLLASKLYAVNNPNITYGIVPSIHAGATSATVSLFNLGNTIGNEGFGILYNPSTGVTKMATNGGNPSTAPVLSMSPAGVDVTGTINATGAVTATGGNVGRVSGVAVTTGNLGETLTFAYTSGGTSQTVTAGTIVDVMTFAVPAGVWLLNIDFSVMTSVGATATGGYYSTLLLRDNSPSVISRAMCSVQVVSVGVQGNMNHLHITQNINIPSSTTYRISLVSNGTAGTSGGYAAVGFHGSAWTTNANVISLILATRIA